MIQSDPNFYRVTRLHKRAEGLNKDGDKKSKPG